MVGTFVFFNVIIKICQQIQNFNFPVIYLSSGTLLYIFVLCMANKPSPLPYFHYPHKTFVKLKKGFVSWKDKDESWSIKDYFSFQPKKRRQVNTIEPFNRLILTNINTKS